MDTFKEDSKANFLAKWTKKTYIPKGILEGDNGGEGAPGLV